ncbi:hypothetical protein U9M48_043438, partial [Paspalum notatum var. saurae]
APEFTKYPKLRVDWELFVQYKESEAAIARSEQNTEIARKRKYNHNMGPGGYRRSIPKWEKMEAELEQRGVKLVTANWPIRSKCWHYGNGGSLSSDRTLIFNDKIKQAAERLVEAIDKSSKGEFVPEREKDELTWALENREHPGRTRGIGNVSWKVGLPEDKVSYRKRKSLSEADAKIRSLEADIGGLRQDLIPDQNDNHDEAPQMVQDQRRAEETQRLPVQDQRPTDEAQPQLENEECYPVNDLKHRCPCKLHIPMRNLSTLVAHGVALPVFPGQNYHCSDIPPGYSVVTLEQIVPSYEDLEVEHKGGDDFHLGTPLSHWSK